MESFTREFSSTRIFKYISVDFNTLMALSFSPLHPSLSLSLSGGRGEKKEKLRKSFKCDRNNEINLNKYSLALEMDCEAMGLGQPTMECFFCHTHYTNSHHSSSSYKCSNQNKTESH